MKKNIKPVDYKYSFGGIMTCGILLLIMSVWITIASIFIETDIEISSFVIYILITLISGIVCIIVGIRKNSNVKRLRKWRDYMLNQPCVDGKIVGVREVKKGAFDKFKSEDEYVTKVDITYVLKVEYENPYTGQVYTIESERYYENPEFCLANDKCKVYIDEKTSRVLVDGLNWKN